ncbi:hypothetical protein EF847_05435 [Actinobacteria bacterium YIM 96077]|uniref:Uncharacterized protein n=1 Tax=Phytoactinopolyspora halophila TaxID=1981511 RepID=A0A329R1J4_9ACTN|nr:hypothetical protein [Phytoactinopolyspora halophila]AYY12233.1 hypothetical protein EF847_05435 [Actinobacteria bacterium YIM 96077]RAW18534.1 hypothetical protein DPM12_00080 [Phytoactinopolyspora halophila]
MHVRRKLRRLGRATARLALGSAVMLALGACWPWSAPAGPTGAGGARLGDEGRFHYWLGAACDGVAEIEVELVERDGNDRRVLDTWRLAAQDDDGARLEHLTLDAVPEGFTEGNALRTDWSAADLIRIGIHSAESQRPEDGGRFYPHRPIRASVSVETFLADVDEHAGAWYVQDRGWFTEEEYRELADDEVYPFCAIPENS